MNEPFYSTPASSAFRRFQASELPRLHELLQKASESYEATLAASDQGSDEAQRMRLLLLAGLTGLCGKVMSISGAGLSGLELGLRDLSSALMSLHNGAQPDWLKPAKLVHSGGAGNNRKPDGHARELLKTMASSCVSMLVLAGMREGAANAFVASALTKTGHRGRKGGNVTSGTVAEWTLRLDVAGRTAADVHVAAFKQAVGEPVTIDGAKEVVRQLLSDVRLRADKR